MNIQQAKEWTRKNTTCESTRERLKSRAAAYALLQEVERLESALFGKDFCYDPTSYRLGMLQAAEIAKEHAVTINQIYGQLRAREEISMAIRAKAEAMK